MKLLPIHDRCGLEKELSSSYQDRSAWICSRLWIGFFLPPLQNYKMWVQFTSASLCITKCGCNSLVLLFALQNVGAIHQSFSLHHKMWVQFISPFLCITKCGCSSLVLFIAVVNLLHFRCITKYERSSPILFLVQQ